MQTSTKAEPRRRGRPREISVQRAGFLDVPLIFQLVQEGSESGSFSVDFLARTGSLKLFFYVLRSIFFQYFQSRRASTKYQWLTITLPDGEVIGFLKLTQGIGKCQDMNLELLAVVPNYRNQGFGSAILQNVLAQVPAEGNLFIHCTKYARAMQHILKKHKLKRNVKFHVPGLEEYQSRPAPLSKSDTFAATR